jgi:hypothetical protein
MNQEARDGKKRSNEREIQGMDRGVCGEGISGGV